MSGKGKTLDQIINSMTPEIHRNLKTAIELGRWESGECLTEDQVAKCLQAVIAYDVKNLQEEDRVAYIDRSKLQTKNCGE